jgi:hypothetical protein
MEAGHQELIVGELGDEGAADGLGVSRRLLPNPNWGRP